MGCGDTCFLVERQGFSAHNVSCDVSRINRISLQMVPQGTQPAKPFHEPAGRIAKALSKDKTEYD